jgi:hypothetical protein
MNIRALLPCLALVIAQAHADTVRGEFVLGSNKIKPSHVFAFRKRDGFNPRLEESYVMMTLSAVDGEAIRTDLDPYAVAINDAATKEDYLAFSVAADGEVSLNARMGGVQYIDSSGQLMQQQGGLKAECSENSATRVACTVQTVKPVKTEEGSWTLDVAFDTAVVTRAKGTPLPNSGGEAGSALMSLAKALEENDLKKILEGLIESERGTFQEDYRSEEENLAWAKELMATRIPRKLRITGGEQLAADRALLEVEGEPWDGTKILYWIEMKKVDATWLYASSITLGIMRN